MNSLDCSIILRYFIVQDAPSHELAQHNYRPITSHNTTDAFILSHDAPRTRKQHEV